MMIKSQDIRIRVALTAAESLSGEVQLHIGREFSDAVQLAGVHVAFHEVDDANLHAVA